jgi:hypothetical protein
MQGAFMSALRMFIPITKVDAARRLVYGLATAETEDRAGEICDYASTKPLYEKWSEEISVAVGVYTFNSADAGKAMLTSYTYTVAVAGQKFTVANQLLGTTPTF